MTMDNKAKHAADILAELLTLSQSDSFTLGSFRLDDALSDAREYVESVRADLCKADPEEAERLHAYAVALGEESEDDEDDEDEDDEGGE